MKFDKGLCCMLLFSFVALTLHKTQLIVVYSISTEELTNRNVLVT